MCSGNGATASLEKRRDVAEATSAAPTRPELRALWVPMVLFVAISVADTISSILMLQRGLMDEYNPLMRYIWETGGAPAFVVVKTVLVVVPLLIFNWLKLRRYWLVRRAVWLTIFGYCVIYALLFCIANY
jgi:hypothetical protein